MVKPILNSQFPLFPLRLQQNERYIETAFDSSETILEKINAVIVRLNQIGKLSNDVIDQWNKVMEWIMENGLEDYVSNKIDSYLSNGVIDTLIENSLNSGKVELFSDNVQTKELKLNPKLSSDVSKNCLFVDIVDNKLKFKNNKNIVIVLE